MECNDFWGIVYKENTAKCKDLVLVVELILGMAFGTSCVEGGFSALRCIITDWQPHLSHDLVTDLLHFSTMKDLESHRFGDLISVRARKFIIGDGKNDKGFRKYK